MPKPKYTIYEDDDGTLVVDGIREPLDLWDALRRYYLKRRPTGHGLGSLRYPETTNQDVLAVVAAFNTEVQRAARDVSGMSRQLTKWKRAAARVAELTADHAPDDTYLENEPFWLRDTKNLSIYLSVAQRLPTRTEILQDLASMSRPPASGKRAQR